MTALLRTEAELSQDPRSEQPQPSRGTPSGRIRPPAASAAEVRHRRWITVSVMLIMDVVAIAAALSVAYALRQYAPGVGRAGDLGGNVLDGSWIIAFGWIAAIAFFGGYRPQFVPSGPEMPRRVLHASMAAAGFVGSALYLTGISLSRAFFIVLFAVGPILLLAGRMALRRVLNFLRGRGFFRKSVLMVGAMPHVDGIVRTISRESWLGYDVLGALVPEGEVTLASAQGVRVLGRETDLIDTIRQMRPSTVIFTAGAASSAAAFRRMAWKLEDLDVDVIVVPGLSEISSDRLSMRPVAGLPLVHLDLPRSREAVRLSKRIFDVVATSGILLCISPLMLVIALVVKLNDGGPVIFRQKRVGRDGELFEFLKFRSMVTDAEARLAVVRAEHQDRGNDVLFKSKDDPRITRPGKFLRRYSLDELPQLWNVLRGDMSLVGPRPALPHEVDAYDDDARRRLTVRPGITGLWQVSGRSDLPWDETVRLDLYYVDNWSFTQDVQILFRTVRAVLSPSGAY